jgi:hypothetical protein
VLRDVIDADVAGETDEAQALHAARCRAQPTTHRPSGRKSLTQRRFSLSPKPDSTKPRVPARVIRIRPSLP